MKEGQLFLSHLWNVEQILQLIEQERWNKKIVAPQPIRFVEQ